MAKHLLLRRFRLYTLFSSLAAGVNVTSRILYEEIMGLQFELAVALAYISGMAVNFAFSKWITFDSGQSRRFNREILKFFAVSSVGLGVTVLVSAVAVRILMYYLLGQRMFSFMIEEESLAMVAHLAGMAAGLVVNFLGHELLSFRETGIAGRIQALFKQSNKESS